MNAYSLYTRKSNFSFFVLQITPGYVFQVVSDKLVEARHHLLNELFNRFAGPIDLASSIQVVNNIRKIPCLSPTQLRVSVLHYRDLFLEKQVMNIRVSRTRN